MSGPLVSVGKLPVTSANCVLQHGQPILGADLHDAVYYRVVAPDRFPELYPLQSPEPFYAALQFVAGELPVHGIEVPERYHPLWVLPGEAQGAVVAGSHKFTRREVRRSAAFQVNAVRAEHHVEALRLRERSLHHLHAAEVYVHVVDHRSNLHKGLLD